MRRPYAKLTVFTIAAFTFGLAYRYIWDDPSQGSIANYMRSGAHAMGLAACGLGAHLYFNARLSKRLRRWPILAEIALRSAAMAIAVALTATVLQMLLYDERPQGAWFFDEFPRIAAITFVISVLFGAAFELTRLIGGRTLLNVILGRYRHPTREERVIMFLDLAGSTALAEKLGELRMQELLTRFFFDIDEPIVAHRGEVHSYVGDEVIVTWPLTGGSLRGRASIASLPSLARLLKAQNSISKGSGRFRNFAPPFTPGRGDQRMRRFASANCALRRYAQRDGKASGALQGEGQASAGISRSPEPRASRVRSSRRIAWRHYAARPPSCGSGIRD